MKTSSIRGFLNNVEENTQNWIRDRLIYHWTAISGKPPEQGGFTPKGDVLDRLSTILSNRGEAELDEWLKLSINAFLHRTRGTATKFFVNSYLLSESALEYLKEFKKQEGAFSVLPNNLNIRSRIMMSETDFMDTVMMINISRGDGKIDYSTGSFKPDVWWMLSAELSGRMLRTEFPEHWMQGTHKISGGSRTSIEDEYSSRRRELRSSNLMRDLLLTEFRIAVSESTISWLESHKLITAVSESGSLTIASSSIDKGLINPSLDPKNRDEKLVQELRSMISVRKLESSKPLKQVNGMNAGTLIRSAVDPIVQKMMEASGED